MRVDVVTLLLASVVGGVLPVAQSEAAAGTVPVSVLILDNAVRRPLYRPVKHWMDLLGDVPVDSVHVPSGECPEALDRYTHMIITGSSSNLSDPEPWHEDEAEIVRAAADRGMAILGGCFGHQMLVYALSGPEFIQPGSTEAGWVAVHMKEDDPLFRDLPNPWHAFTCHSDYVVDPPPPWRLLGGSDLCAVNIIRYGSAPIWGIQTHPEINPSVGKSMLWLIHLFSEPENEAVAKALHQEPEDDEVAAVLVDRFLIIRP